MSSQGLISLSTGTCFSWLKSGTFSVRCLEQSPGAAPGPTWLAPFRPGTAPELRTALT
jgi:hypothetical protein